MGDRFSMGKGQLEMNNSFSVEAGSDLYNQFKENQADDMRELQDCLDERNADVLALQVKANEIQP